MTPRGFRKCWQQSTTCCFLVRLTEVLTAESASSGLMTGPEPTPRSELCAPCNYLQDKAQNCLYQSLRAPSSADVSTSCPLISAATDHTGAEGMEEEEGRRKMQGGERKASAGMVTHLKAPFHCLKSGRSLGPACPSLTKSGPDYIQSPAASPRCGSLCHSNSSKSCHTGLVHPLSKSSRRISAKLAKCFTLGRSQAKAAYQQDCLGGMHLQPMATQVRKNCGPG